MRTFEFYDRETGEKFFVECDTATEAIETAKQYFKKPKFLGEVDEEYAEILGYDTY